MTSVLIHLDGLKGIPQLVGDLEGAGVQVLGVVTDRAKLVKEVVRHAPDLLICDVPLPDDAFFRVTLSIALTAPCAVLVFTNDPDAANIARAVESGIHAYVVQGYGTNRVRPLMQLAQTRFRHDTAQRSALQDMSKRVEENTLLDRAKGILMRARQLSDDEAVHILRTAAQQTNQPLGQVSQQIIHSARFAQDVNRSGQLRMLSQRLVKLYALRRMGLPAGPSERQFQDTEQQIEGNLAHLRRNLSQATYGDLLGQVVQTWTELQRVVQGVPATDPVASTYEWLDDLAERMLRGAERLTANLESTGMVPPLRVLNLAGRQRMLSQRFAKFAVLRMLGDVQLAPRIEVGLAESKEALEKALDYLVSIPLNTPEIHAALREASTGWLHLLEVARQVEGAAVSERVAQLQVLAVASEDLLEVFERLSVLYERSAQMLALT